MSAAAAAAIDAEVEIAGVGPRDVRHNGGKVAVITCGADESDAVCDRLDASHAVRTYEVVR